MFVVSFHTIQNQNSLPAVAVQIPFCHSLQAHSQGTSPSDCCTFVQQKNHPSCRTEQLDHNKYWKTIMRPWVFHCFSIFWTITTLFSRLISWLFDLSERQGTLTSQTLSISTSSGHLQFCTFKSAELSFSFQCKHGLFTCNTVTCFSIFNFLTILHKLLAHTLSRHD